ncbi:MAG: hypothetical protein WC670_06720 [Pseudolabrys sp.]|jgi:hypothetical protein
MAKGSKRKAHVPTDRGGGDLLKSFLASADLFVETISAQGLAVAGHGEERLIIQSTGESVVAQMRKLTDFVREAAATISSDRRRELDQFLRVQDGDAIVARGLRVSGQVLSGRAGPVTRGFFSWLNEHIQTIKKIIMAILTLIFGHLPEWVNTVMVIIDEIFNLLKSLLGGKLGLRMSDVADDASREEVNFLREMKALAELQAAGASRRTTDDESSNKRNGS